MSSFFLITDAIPRALVSIIICRIARRCRINDREKKSPPEQNRDRKRNCVLEIRATNDTLRPRTLLDTFSMLRSSLWDPQRAPPNPPAPCFPVDPSNYFGSFSKRESSASEHSIPLERPRGELHGDVLCQKFVPTKWTQKCCHCRLL